MLSTACTVALAALSAAPTDRLVIAGVPKIGYGVHLCPFPGSLFSLMEHLGDPCEYDDVMAVTGAAFRRLWERDDGGNVDLMYLSPEPERRAFRALGYDFRAISPKDRGEMLRALKESLARGRPVLAFGIIGPPECGIVTGYEKGGDALVGYSYFQDARLPGYYTKEKWYEEADWAGDVGFILVGDRRPKPPQREILISTLEWAVDLARAPKRPGHPNHASGLAAYDAWAAALDVDSDYPDDPNVMGTRIMVQGDQTVMLIERENGARYLRRMASIAPEAAEPLKGAADLYEQVAKAKVWPWGHDMGPAAQAGLRDAKTRREIAAEVRRARGLEEQAVAQLEKALAALPESEQPA